MDDTWESGSNRVSAPLTDHGVVGRCWMRLGCTFRDASPTVFARVARLAPETGEWQVCTGQALRQRSIRSSGMSRVKAVMLLCSFRAGREGVMN